MLPPHSKRPNKPAGSQQSLQQQHRCHDTVPDVDAARLRDNFCMISLTEYDPAMLDLKLNCGGNVSGVSRGMMSAAMQSGVAQSRSTWVSPLTRTESMSALSDTSQRSEAAAAALDSLEGSPLLGVMFDATPIGGDESDGMCKVSHQTTDHREACPDPNEPSPALDLGAGASGRVRGMHCPTLGVPIAVKTIRETTDSKRYNAACEFAYAQRVLECPEVDASEGLVRVLEVVRETESRVTHVAMEYLPGGTAAQLVAGTVAYPLSPTSADVGDVGDAGDALSTRLVDRVFTSALRLAGSEFSRLTALRRVAAGGLRGLHTLHAKLHVVHRDITPRNLLVDAAGDVKIADFGVAAVLPLDGAQPQEAREQAGSVAYMSPERLRGEAHGPASDVWALGVVLLELALGGQHPFIAAGAAGAEAGERFWAITTRLLVTEGEAACEEATRLAVAAAIRDADVDADFADLLRRMLAAHPDDRATAAALLSDPALLLF